MTALARRSSAQRRPVRQIFRERALPIELIVDAQPRGMQGMPRQQELVRQFIVPARLDKTEVKLFVGAVNLVADNRVTKMREVHADLMRSPGVRNGTHDGERAFPSGAPPNKSSFH